MKHLHHITALLVVGVIALAAQAEDPVARGTRLMKYNDERPVFQKVKSYTTLRIYGSSGKLRFKKKLVMGAYTKNMGLPSQNEMYISTFLSPPEDRGNAYLAYNYKNRNDVKWVYLKGLRKAKKVTGADTRMSFFGSDFTNGDMGKPDFRNWKYRYLGDDKVKFKGRYFDCFMVESKPETAKVRRDFGYGRKVTYIEKKTRLTLKLEYFDLDMNKKKEMRLLSFIKKKNIKGQTVYYETGLQMKNVRKGTKTMLKFSNLKFEGDANISPDIFTTQYLKRKWW